MEMVREQTDQWTQLMNAQRRTRWDLTKGRQSCCFCCWGCVIGLADAVRGDDDDGSIVQSWAKATTVATICQRFKFFLPVSM